MRRILISATIALLSAVPAYAADFEDPFGSGANSDTTILRAMEPRDYHVSFSINNRPIGYKTMSFPQPEASADRLKQLDRREDGSKLAPADFEEFEEQFLTAIRIAKASADEDPRPLANALDCIGVLYYRNQQFDKALSYFLESLSVKRSGFQESEIASGCDLAAQAARASYKYEDAEKLYREALELKTKSFGSNSIEVAISHMNLAYLYYDRLDSKSALAAERAAHNIVALNRSKGTTIPGDIVAPINLLACSSATMWPKVVAVARSIVNDQKLMDAEKRAENEALASLQGRVLPRRPKPKYATWSRQYGESGGTDSQYRNRSSDNRNSEEENDLRRRELELRKRELEAQQESRRQALEDERRRQQAEETRRMEEREMAAHRQQEQSVTGTSYMSRYGH